MSTDGDVDANKEVVMERVQAEEQTTDWAFEHGRLRYRIDRLRLFIEGALEAIEDEDYYGAPFILRTALKDFQPPRNHE